MMRSMVMRRSGSGVGAEVESGRESERWYAVVVTEGGRERNVEWNRVDVRRKRLVGGARESTVSAAGNGRERDGRGTEEHHRGTGRKAREDGDGAVVEVGQQQRSQLRRQRAAAPADERRARGKRGKRRSRRGTGGWSGSNGRAESDGVAERGWQRRRRRRGRPGGAPPQTPRRPAAPSAASATPRRRTTPGGARQQHPPSRRGAW